MTEFDLNDFLPYRLAVAASRVSRGFAERYREEFGLSIPDWRVLAHLSQSGAVSVREIHARVDMDKSKVSRAATRLESAGFVQKETDPKDKRLVRLSLTGEGRALVARIIPLARAYQDELMALLGSDAEAVHRALGRLSGVGASGRDATEDGRSPGSRARVDPEESETSPTRRSP